MNTIILVLLAVLPQSHAAVYVFRSETNSGFRAGTTDVTATLYIAVTGGNVSPPWNIEPLFSKSVTISSVSGPAGSSATGSGGTITETALTVTGGQIYTYEVIYSFSGNTATTYDGVSLSSNFDHVKVPTVAQDGVLEAQDITATSITTTPTATTTTTPTTTTTTTPTTTTTTPTTTTTTPTTPITTTTTTPTTTTTTTPTTTTTTTPTTTTTTTTPTTTTTTTTTPTTTTIDPTLCFSAPTFGLYSQHDGVAASYATGDTVEYSCNTNAEMCDDMEYTDEMIRSSCQGLDSWLGEPMKCCLTFNFEPYEGCFTGDITTTNMPGHVVPNYFEGRKHCHSHGAAYSGFYGRNSNTTEISVLCLDEDEFTLLSETLDYQCDTMQDGYLVGNEEVQGSVAVLSLYQTFYGEYYLRELNPYILNSDSHSFDNAATDESCAEYCSLSHGDLKKVYSIIYNASDCYCLDTRNSTVTAAEYGGVDCNANSISCSLFPDATEFANSYPNGSSCFDLFESHDRLMHGYYKLGDGWIKCHFYDGTYCEQDWIGFNGLCYAFTTEQGDFQEQEHKCAEMDANLVTITDSHHSSYVDKWTTDFLTLIFPKLAISGSSLYIGGYQPMIFGDTTEFKWLDGSINHEPPFKRYSGYPVLDASRRCLAIKFYQNIAFTTNEHCNITTNYGVCQKMSIVLDGVRSHGCWGLNSTNTRLHGPTMTPLSLSVSSPKECISALTSEDLLFGVQQAVCHTNSTAHTRYVVGRPSKTCVSGMGSADAFNIYVDGSTPRASIYSSSFGYIGCYPFNGVDGELKFTSNIMTLQACIEGCFGTPVTAYQYKFAAVNNDTCHCYADIFASAVNQNLRESMVSCDLPCPGNEMQRCGKASNTLYLNVYSAVKFYPNLWTCTDVAVNFLPVITNVAYRMRYGWFWYWTTTTLYRSYCPSTVVTHSDENCPTSWLRIYDRCFKVIPTSHYHHRDALETCRSYGGDLYRPGTELTELLRVIQMTSYRWTYRFSVGVSRVSNTTDEFFWSDGSLTTWTLYDKFNTRDDLLYGTLTGNDCFHTTVVYQQFLNTLGCAYNYAGFICSMQSLDQPQIYQGCADMQAQSASDSDVYTQHSGMTSTYCGQYCLTAGTRYSAVQDQTCQCIDDINSLTMVDRVEFCGDSCSGSLHQDCGGALHSSIYSVDYFPAESCLALYYSGHWDNSQYILNPGLKYGVTQEAAETCVMSDNSEGCENGWIGFMNRCYYFSQDAVTFDEAYSYCLARNSLIVSISHNSSEATFVEKSIKSRSEFRSIENFYVGLYRMDDGNYASSGYAWVDSGTNSFNRYSSSWDHNYASRSCVVMVRSDNYAWTNVECNTNASFICRSDPVDEMKCSVPPSSAEAGLNFNYYRLSNTLCREICQGEGYDYAVTQADNCQCHNASSVVGLSHVNLAECNIPCATHKYQQCGGTSKAMVIHSGSACPYGWTLF
ncbi:hypothetical protein EB796_002751 [Bugula neritina]|uniref:SVEP1 n=1 Tax=Bugula neritina TaxID=10212 RepID=A0A7J7KJN9_BUGNE|nr:hypothetical protein EB796_002751 [Bugula neritina]